MLYRSKVIIFTNSSWDAVYMYEYVHKTNKIIIQSVRVKTKRNH